jgi:hypothetical protein
MSVAEDITDGLRWFLEKLRNNEPIEATRVERFATPDGPMHVHTKMKLFDDGEAEPKE